MSRRRQRHQRPPYPATAAVLAGVAVLMLPGTGLTAGLVGLPVVMSAERTESPPGFTTTAGPTPTGTGAVVITYDTVTFTLSARAPYTEAPGDARVHVTTAAQTTRGWDSCAPGALSGASRTFSCTLGTPLPTSLDAPVFTAVGVP